MRPAVSLLLLAGAVAPADGLQLVVRSARHGVQRVPAVICEETASASSLRDQMKAYLDMVRRVPAASRVEQNGRWAEVADRSGRPRRRSNRRGASSPPTRNG